MGSVIGSLALSLMLFDTWFYWGHRLLQVHHRRAHLRLASRGPDARGVEQQQ